jgi:hypothetical protein
MMSFDSGGNGIRPTFRRLQADKCVARDCNKLRLDPWSTEPTSGRAFTHFTSEAEVGLIFDKNTVFDLNSVRNSQNDHL